MKIADETILKNGEKELIATINSGLDWSAIQKIFKEKHRMEIQDEAEYRQGDIVVYNNSAAYRLNYDVKVTFSILLDKSGGFLALTTSDDNREKLQHDNTTIPEESLKQGITSPIFTHVEDENEPGEKDLIELSDIVEKAVVS